MKKTVERRADAFQSDASQEIDGDSDTVEKPETSKSAEDTKLKHSVGWFPDWFWG